MRVPKSAAAFVLIWLSGLVLAYVAHATLPERYYFDAQVIGTLIDDPGFEWSDSFRRTALAYRLLGFGALWPDALAAALGYTVAIAAIAWGARLARGGWQPATYLLIAAWCIPVAVYHGQFSKEMYAIAAVAAMLWLSTSARGVVVAALIALAYAAVFRSYWAVIVALWLVLLAGWRAGLGWPLRLALVGAAILALSAASEAIVGFRLSDGRTLVIEDRDLEPDSATVFFNPLENTSSATDLANAFAGWLTLVLPFYLFTLGAVQHVAFAAFQLLNTALFVCVARRTAAPCGGAPDAHRWRQSAAASWCVAFTIVQGMFEPDFGSFIKHQTNLVPMLAYLYLSAWRAPLAPAATAVAR